MKVKTYDILVRAIEEGIDIGWARANKHTPTPSGKDIKDAISVAIGNQLDEVFDFSDETDV